MESLNTPILWINAYLREKLQDELGFDTVPFVPTGPSTLDVLQSTFPDVAQDGVMSVYDRMFRKRKRAFPHIKCEQVLYYFYAVGAQPQLTMIKLQEEIMNLMDNEDETAEDINRWAADKGLITVTDYVGTTQTQKVLEPKFYFHGFKIYHLEEARDIVDFGTARTFAGNKIIIDYDYHSTKNNN